MYVVNSRFTFYVRPGLTRSPNLSLKWHTGYVTTIYYGAKEFPFVGVSKKILSLQMYGYSVQNIHFFKIIFI